jgi:Ca2+-transporting ATPase
VEALGATTVLCVDKTGTLTLNRMKVVEVVAGDAHQSMLREQPRALAREFAAVVDTAALASRPDAFDPMERAIIACARDQPLEFPAHSALVREYALSDRLLAVTHVWRGMRGQGYTVTTKGAPEAVASMCRLSETVHARLVAQVDALAREGLRVIAVARCNWPSERLPDAATDFPFTYVGLIGLADPVRPGVPEAIEECRAARIRVVMITGDHPTTALNIGRQIGLARTTTCLQGAEIAAMTDEELRESVQRVDIFARITPDQKLRLVTALRANGEVVAMTGDGVNDAPALKAADIGVAMGGRGTDVAREAAALVLLDDDFTSVVRAVRLGRRIYSNIEKATAYVLGIHVPIAGIALIPAVMGWPLILTPVHVIFMELIIDPASSIAFEMEPEEHDLMRRPPRDPRQRLFTARMMTRAILQGAGACLVAAAVLAASVMARMTELDIRTLTFSTLIMANLALIASNRSATRPVWTTIREPNPSLRWLVAGAIGVLAAVVYVPALRGLFRLTTLHVDDVGVVVLATIAALAWMEWVKRLCRPDVSRGAADRELESGRRP